MWRYLVVAASVALGAIPARGDLIVNGSFETPTAPVGVYSTQIPDGWSSLGNGSIVDIISSGYAGAIASEGSQFVDLIGRDAGTFPSGLAQTVTLQAGLIYALSFDYNGSRYNDGSPTSGAVLEYFLGSFVSGSINVDDLNVFADNGPVTPWRTSVQTFTVATTGSYALTFRTPAGAFASPMLDNVRLTAVPEPSSLISAALGLAGLAGYAGFRRGRSAKR